MDTGSHAAFTRRSVLRGAQGWPRSHRSSAARSPRKPCEGLDPPRNRRRHQAEGDGFLAGRHDQAVGRGHQRHSGVPQSDPSSREEYGGSYATYERHIAYLASQKCNVIVIEGAPPFMLLGPAREAEMIEGWKRKYNTDMFTSSQNQVSAFKALKAREFSA
jgi:hypothetical protein